MALSYSESISAHSILNIHLMLRFSIMPILFTKPAYDSFYFENLEMSLMRYAGEVQGPY